MKILRSLTCVFALIVAAAACARAQGHVVISQVYGGGGNNGATYRYDFVELYNPTTSAVDLSGYTLQYGSATSTSATGFSKIQLTGSIAPGKYYLAQLCIGNTGTTNGALLPTPDFTAANSGTTATCAAPALAAGAGRVALVSNTTLLSGIGTTAGLGGTNCPTANTAAIVDFVGYGSTANCTESPTTAVSRTADLSATLSAIRDGSNDDTGNNGADFTVGTPNPRNSAYSTVPAAVLAIANSSATPASITAGSSTLLSVTVTPGTATTSVTATADLSTVGGSAAQPLTLSSTANTYTYTLATSAGLAASAYTLPVTVKDNTNATATQNIALTVVAAGPSSTPISTIQANRGTYVGTSITFTGVVTVATNAGFYVQTPSATPGSTGDEGIYIYSGTGKVPATALVGNNVTITGTLTQFPLPTASHTPSLEVTGASITVNSTGQTLPTPIAIPAPSAAGDINQLRKYESMLVSLPSMTAVGGTDASLVETTETTTSNGQFYVVGTGTQRPFREPGMDFRDFPSASCPTFANCPAASNPATAAGDARPANLVLYDDNPERLIIESSLGGSTPIDVTAGAVITGAAGVVDYSYSTDYPYGDPARVILSASNHPAVTASTLVPTPLPAVGANQFTVAAFNVERFFDPIAANNVYFDAGTGKTAGTSAVNITTDAYARRLKKFSLAVRTVLNNPDIISVEEVENLQVLKDMAAQIDADTTTGAKPGYIAYGTDGVTTFTDDTGGISIGFLVKPSTVNVTAWEQKGTTDTVPGSGITLNDRPSQVLHATINRGSGVKPYPITVISNHLRSLQKVNTADVQIKKELQAEMLANLIQGYQQAGEHVIAVGDMNAFEFSDGYTDTLGTITGRITAGVSVTPGKAIVNPVATDLITTLPAVARQSYTEWGNAQVLDHAVVTADIADSSFLQVGHIDGDYPVSLYNDATTPAAMSDHDPILAYLNLPAPLTSAALTGSGTFANSIVVGQSSTGQQLVLTNTGETAITLVNTGFNTTGDFAQTNNCGTSLAVGSTCQVNVVFTPTAAGNRTGTITFTGSATVAPVTLTGTGLLPADFTLTDSASSTSSALSLPAGTSGTVALKLTSVNGFAGSVALTCASTGTAATGVSCTVTSPVTLAAAGTGSATVTLTTTARTSVSGLGMLPANTSGRITWLVIANILALAAFSIRRKGNAGRIGGLLTLLFALTIGVAGCGNSSKLNTTSNSNGTANGTYTYTVTATSGTLSHTQKITLTVAN